MAASGCLDTHLTMRCSVRIFCLSGQALARWRLLLSWSAVIAVGQPNIADALPKPLVCVYVPGTTLPDCDGDGYAASQGDCDDGQKSVFPGAAELCNGLDDDCDGATDESVPIAAGTCLSLGLCAGPASDGGPVTKCAGAAGFVCSYSYGYEDVAETLCDGYDNDCDGATDEGLRNACDTCGEPPAEQCNGQDDDCDGLTDEDLSLPSSGCNGMGVCSGATTACQNGVAVCVFPMPWEVTETLCDTLDNDCDGQTDEELGVGQVCFKGQGVCAGSGVLYCAADGSVACSGMAGQPATELCGDGVDNDCNGKTDESFAVGSQCVVGEGACRVYGKTVCTADRSAVLCNVKPLPAGVEVCDNTLDDNCDGATDEAPCTASPGLGADLSCQASQSGQTQTGHSAKLVVTILAMTGGIVLLRRRGRWSLARYLPK